MSVIDEVAIAMAVRDNYQRKMSEITRDVVEKTQWSTWAIEDYDNSKVKPLRDRIKFVENNLKRLVGDLAANPRYWDELVCWMIDMTGYVKTDDDCMKEAIENIDDIKNTVVRVGGSLSQLVSDAVHSWGYRITDSGMGCEQWDMGVPCNDVDAKRLCNLLYIEFGEEIRRGNLRVNRKFWGFRFWELYNDGDALKWVKEHNLENVVKEEINKVEKYFEEGGKKI